MILPMQHRHGRQCLLCMSDIDQAELGVVCVFAWTHVADYQRDAKACRGLVAWNRPYALLRCGFTVTKALD